MKITLIAAMAANRVIGRDNKMPWHIPADLKRFKELTLGHPVIMGRKTYESLGRPLPGRLNVVLSKKNPVKSDFTLITVLSFPSLILAVQHCAAEGAEEAFVIGGAQIYKLAMPWAQRIFLTQIHRSYEGDALFPEIPESFREVAREDHPENDPPFSYLTLERQ